MTTAPGILSQRDVPITISLDTRCAEYFLQVDESQTPAPLFLFIFLHVLPQCKQPICGSSPLPESLLFSISSHSIIFLIRPSTTVLAVGSVKLNLCTSPDLVQLNSVGHIFMETPHRPTAGEPEEVCYGRPTGTHSRWPGLLVTYRVHRAWELQPLIIIMESKSERRNNRQQDNDAAVCVWISDNSGDHTHSRGIARECVRVRAFLYLGLLPPCS